MYHNDDDGYRIECDNPQCHETFRAAEPGLGTLLFYALEKRWLLTYDTQLCKKCSSPTQTRLKKDPTTALTR